MESEAQEIGQEGMRVAVPHSDGDAYVQKTAHPVSAVWPIAVPSPRHVEIARVEALEAESSLDLQRMVSAMQAAAAKCDPAYDQLVRQAIHRLEVERDMEAHLAQDVARGRPAIRSPDGTICASALSEGIGKMHSVAYQRLAAIPVASSQSCLEEFQEARGFA